MKLIGLGDNTVDIYVDHGLEFPGGNAVNVAVFAQRLGAIASYLGCVGNDERAQLIADSLIAEGVSISRLRRLNEANSWSRIRHDGNDRVFDGSHRIDLTKYDLSAEDFSYIASHDHCHTSIYSGLEDDLANIAEASQCLSYDFSDEFTPDQMASIGPLIDIAFLSGSNLDSSECTKVAEFLQSLGCSRVVITRGSSGAMGFAGREVAISSPAKGDVVDTLGAGDGFIAGFLVAYHAGAPLQEALNQGAVSAAKACSEQGAYGHGVQVAV